MVNVQASSSQNEHNDSSPSKTASFTKNSGDRAFLSPQQKWAHVLITQWTVCQVRRFGLLLAGKKPSREFCINKDGLPAINERKQMSWPLLHGFLNSVIISLAATHNERRKLKPRSPNPSCYHHKAHQALRLHHPPRRAAALQAPQVPQARPPRAPLVHLGLFVAGGGLRLVCKVEDPGGKVVRGILGLRCLSLVPQPRLRHQTALIDCLELGQARAFSAPSFKLRPYCMQRRHLCTLFP